MKVLHRDLSFLGTKGLGYEKCVIRDLSFRDHISTLTLTLTDIKIPISNFLSSA